MLNLTEFGTDKWPLHPSGIRTVLTCNWSTIMRRLLESIDEAGPAADTGSATHVAVREMHRGKELAACIAAMHAESSKYPNADLNDAAAMFLKYASDPRNRDAEVVCTERQISFDIAPAPEDKTQAPIHIEGTVDQVRRVNGVLKVADLKTTKKEALETLYKHTTQLAAYCVGATIALGEPVDGAMLILPRKYKDNVATSPVFWHYPWRLQDTEQILQPLRHVVARIRNGDVWHNPSDLCIWCAAGGPDNCLPRLHEHRRTVLSLGMETR